MNEYLQILLGDNLQTVDEQGVMHIIQDIAVSEENKPQDMVSPVKILTNETPNETLNETLTPVKILTITPHNQLPNKLRVPTNRIKKWCDELWRLNVLNRYESIYSSCTRTKLGLPNTFCFVCNKLKNTNKQADLIPHFDNFEQATKGINVHHLISRAVLKYRYVIINGIPLCPNHHEFNSTLSAHTAPFHFYKYVTDNDPEIKQFLNEVTYEENYTPDYHKTYKELEQYHKLLTGHYYKPQRIQFYLLHNLMTKEQWGILLGDLGYKALGKKYGVSANKMKEFLIGIKVLNLNKGRVKV